MDDTPTAALSFACDPSVVVKTPIANVCNLVEIYGSGLSSVNLWVAWERILSLINLPAVLRYSTVYT